MTRGLMGRRSAVLGLVLVIAPGAFGQGAGPDERLVRAREVFGAAIRVHVEDLLVTVMNEERGRLPEVFGCDAEHLPEVMSRFLLDAAWADEVLDLTAAEARAIRAGKFDDAGNRKRFRDRATLLCGLDIDLPKAVTRMIARQEAG